MQQVAYSYTPSARIYRNRMWSSPWWRLYYAALITFFFLLIVSNAWKHDKYQTALVAVYLPLIAWTWWRESQTLLMASADGLTYHANGYVLYARWEDVVGLGKPPQSSWRVSEGLILRHWQWWPRPGWGWMQRRNLGFIPLRFRSMGTPYWESGIGDELLYYAPCVYPANHLQPGVMEPYPSGNSTPVQP